MATPEIISIEVDNNYKANFVDFRYSTEIKEKSIIIGLPVVALNQSKHSDVCSYLQYVQNFSIDIYKSEVEFKRCVITNMYILILVLHSILLITYSQTPLSMRAVHLSFYKQ